MAKYLPTKSLDSDTTPTVQEDVASDVPAPTALFTFNAASDADAFHAAEIVKHLVQLGRKASIIDGAVVVA